MLLDSGSTGLHIYTPGVRTGPGSGVKLTSRRTQATYFDGMVQRGVVADAKLTIAGMKTEHPVPIGVVDYVGCVDGVPECPGGAGMASQVSHGFYGIMGIALTRYAGLGNPLLALPAPYSRRWSIALNGSRGRLTMGVPVPRHPVAKFTLLGDGRDPGGARDWNDHQTKVCWSAVGLRGAGCEPTVFDTGSVTMFWYGGLLSRTTTYPGSPFVSPGTYIAAWQRGRDTPFWTFTAGTRFSQDTVIAFHGGHPLVIAAVQAFLRFKITYDDADGRIYVSRLW